MFTILLLRDGAMGLQIKPVAFEDFYSPAAAQSDEEGWQDCVVPAEMPAGGAAIVNTGALMARWTNDEWKATAHRVVVPDAEAARAERYSFAAFFDPDSEATVAVHPRFVAAGEEPKYPPLTSGEFLLMMLRASSLEPRAAL